MTHILHSRQIALLLVLASSPVWGETSHLDRWQGVTYPNVSPSDQRLPSVLTRNIIGSGASRVVFWDDQIGWVSGYGGVFATTDGGFTWKRFQKSGGWLGLGMTGPREAWLLGTGHGEPAGKPRSLLKTVDGGATWQSALSSPFLCLNFLLCRGREIWASGQNRFFHSADGGTTWEEQTFGGLLSAPIKVAIPGDRPMPSGGFIVYATGYPNHAAKSEDGGKTWKKLSIPADLGCPTQIFFINSETGWISGDNGNIIYTCDGGQTWTHRDLPAKRLITALWFDQLGRGYAAVHEENFIRFSEPEVLFQTLDSGRTWTPALRNFIDVFGICDCGPGKVFAVGVIRSNMPDGVIVFLPALGDPVCLP